MSSVVQHTTMVTTSAREELIDITADVQHVIRTSGIREGIANVFVRGATAALMIQENWDDSVQRDVLTLLRQLAPPGVWEHDRQDGNGDAHLKAGLVGPSETIPVTDGSLALGRWQNLFLCEFDGPRDRREIVITIIGTGHSIQSG
ncbi:MAG: secondary thiamine-phosphate synthase enzyme YjbQ [Acidimicrobiales bacterium]|nr:secondary thiamine-phosphate synthase enzyme YjbQ [Acidimicrobiales bacterium]